MLSFNSKQAKVAGCVCRSGFKSCLIFSFTQCLCIIPTRQGWAGFLPPKPGSKGEDTRKVPKTMCWGTRLKLSHLPCYLNSYTSYLFFYSLYFWNFSSGTYWLKNKCNQQPTLVPLNEKAATQQLRIFIFFLIFFKSISDFSEGNLLTSLCFLVPLKEKTEEVKYEWFWLPETLCFSSDRIWNFM